MPIISNSDIETSQKCERMYYYSRIMRIQPKLLPPFIRRGSFGHTMLEEGFKVTLAGGTVEDAMQAAAVPLTTLMNSDDPHKSEMMPVYRHVCAFLSYVYSDKAPWRPVALEDVGLWNVTKQEEYHKDGLDTPDYIFAYTPDLVIEFTNGIYKGQHAVLDYKFLSQYMTEAVINMAQQIPKYIIYRNKKHTDFKIRRGAFVQFNTRASATDSGHKLFLIKWIEPTKAAFEQIEKDNEVLVERVAKLHQGDSFIRTVNKDVCGRCFFQEICAMERDGKDITRTVERNFVTNTYGY